MIFTKIFLNNSQCPEQSNLEDRTETKDLKMRRNSYTTVYRDARNMEAWLVDAQTNHGYG